MQVILSFVQAQWPTLVGTIAGVYLGGIVYRHLRRAAGAAALRCSGLDKPS